METSILTSVKQILGLTEDNTAFDLDILTNINTAFSILYQLGVGPSAGFTIDSATDVWQDFLPNGNVLNMVKTYVNLKVRSLFDPPKTSFEIAGIKEQLDEYENRLVLAVEMTGSL